MLNVNGVLGVERFLSDPAIHTELKRYIMENLRYVVPGYGCDYYLHTFDNDLDFYLCKDHAENDLGISVHFSNTKEMDLVFDNYLDTNGLAHIYSMHRGKDGTKLPVRVVCPEVLACPKVGDTIHGQIVAIADEMSILEDKSEKDFSVTDMGNGCVKIVGRIGYVNSARFKFADCSTEYWDANIETSIGDISVVIQKNKLNFEPEDDQFFEATAILSFDVAVPQRTYSKMPFSEECYDGEMFNSGINWKNGFVPNKTNAERVLMNCIEKGQHARFKRACKKSVRLLNRGCESVAMNEDIPAAFGEIIPQGKCTCELVNILSCDDTDSIGRSAIAVKSNGAVTDIISMWLDRQGYVQVIDFFDTATCKVGSDPELHAVAVVGWSLCSCNANFLSEYFADDCIYRSDYADKMVIGAKRIITRLNKVASNLDQDSLYSFEILPTSEVLRQTNDLPAIYKGAWCAKEYQHNELAAIIFVQLNEDNKISNVLLSRDGKYLTEFPEVNAKEVEWNNKNANVRTMLEEFYGKEETLQTMRNNDTPNEEEGNIYVWKEADNFARTILKEKGYKVSNCELEDDCIGYACTRRGIDYAVFFYAYGKEKTTSLDAEYCQRLRNNPISRNRTILVAYVKVDAVTDDDGNKKYQVGGYGGSKSVVELLQLTSVNGKNILLFYPGSEILKMVKRFVAAYNAQNLDLLKSIFALGVELEYPNGGCAMNDGVYSSLSHTYENYGKMKIAYYRINDVTFSMSAYIENYKFFNFTVTNGNQICKISEMSLDDSFKEIVFTDDEVEHSSLNDYPSLVTAEFLPVTKEGHLSALLTFANGEKRLYTIPCQKEIEDVGGEDNLVDYESGLIETRSIAFTEKIFRHGKIVEQIEMPHWIGYRNYPKRGQGIIFANGYSISTAELYFKSYPVGVFNYTDYEDRVSIKQFDYDDQGFGLGYISSIGEGKTLYLLDRNTMIAKELPQKYQNTPFVIYPFCGGTSEGRVMVSLLGEIKLQYHHNRRFCAGMWGWLDTDLNEVISPQYIYAMNFMDGRAIVCKGEWDIKDVDGKKVYWCDNEQWGVIDIDGNEVIPCEFDDIYEVDNSNRLFFVHEGGWENGHSAIYDTEQKKVILQLDFDFDIGYMFNECFVSDNDTLVFMDHLPGKEMDLLYVYDLNSEKYLVYKQEYTERTYNGQKKVVVNKDGKDIIVF